MSRDDFTQAVKKQLAMRVAYRCSNPDCRRATTGPQVDPQKSTNIGVAAHIHAASKNGPRFNKEQSSIQRGSIENGIWLCQNCAKLIDDDDDRYSTEKLKRWKEEAENSAHISLQQQVKSEDELDTFLRLANKMPDLIEEMATNLHNNEENLIREFVLLYTRGNIFNSRKPRFVYYRNDHPNLDNAVDLLNEYGFVRVTKLLSGSDSIYKMTENFVDLVKTLHPKEPAS